MFLVGKTLLQHTLQTCLVLSPLILLFSPPTLNPQLSIKPDNQPSPTPNCEAQDLNQEADLAARINRVTEQLKYDNITESCAVLEQNCPETNLTSSILYASSDSVFRRSSSCDIMWPQFGDLDQEEENFPLGFYITAYMDARNLEILLSTIFRPHNSYCVHVDSKAEPIFVSTVDQLLSCYQARYPNTFISMSSRSTAVYWGHFSIVEAELICLADLIQSDNNWQYAINVAGSEMMLVTNKQLVKRIRSTGKMDTIFTMSEPILPQDEFRFRKKFILNTNASYDPEFKGSLQGIMPEDPKGPDIIPFHLQIYKGIKSHHLPRSFVDFLLNHPVASTFIDWSKTTFIPDEMVVPTLARISTMNFTSEGWKVEQEYKPQYPNHLQLWQEGSGHTCLGCWRHDVCVFGLEDLPMLLKSGKHIANKFRSDFDPLAAECLADIIQRRDAV